MQILPRRLIFPSIKKRGGSTKSKFVQNVRLFSQLRFKAHNIGSLYYQSGILWSAYPVKLWALVPCRHRMQKKHAETHPQVTPHHPERLTRSTRNDGPSVFISKVAIKCLTIRTRDAKVASKDVIGWRLRRNHTGNWVIRRRRGAATEGTAGRVRRAVAGLGNSE